MNKCLSFGRNGHSGNAVCVIRNGEIPLDQRLNFAKEMNLPATVFMEAASAKEDAFDLDFYYPHIRSRLCLSAALAACAIYFSEQPNCAEFTFGTCFHPQRLGAFRRDGLYFLRTKAHISTTAAVDVPRLLSLLGLKSSEVLSNPAVSSVGSPKMLVEVPDVDTLHAMRPDLEGIVRWGAEHQISGCYAYCQPEPGLCRGRNFNHLDASLEDAATGVAAGALALHLQRDIIAEQGDMLGNPSLIHALYSGETVDIGGRVVLL